MTIDEIDIPDGMLSAACNGAGGDSMKLKRALLWLAENPIAPTEQQADEMYNRLYERRTFGWQDIRDAATEWQGRMFLKPESAVPNEVLALAKRAHYLGNEEGNRDKLPALLREAYEMGRKERTA